MLVTSLGNVLFTELSPTPTLPGRFSNPILQMHKQDQPQSMAIPHCCLLGGSHERGTGTGNRWHPPPPTLAAPSPSPDHAPPRGRPLTCRCRSESAEVGEPLAHRGCSLPRRPRQASLLRRPRCPLLPCLAPSPAAEAASIAAGEGGREAVRGRRLWFLLLTRLGVGGPGARAQQTGHSSKPGSYRGVI